jgi:FMN-dependent NADH-azoreductase
MIKILKVLASVNSSGSISRMLAYEFVDQWMRMHAYSRVFERDLGKYPPFRESITTGLRRPQPSPGPS